MDECTSHDPETGVPCLLGNNHEGAHVAHVRWADEIARLKGEYDK